MFQYIVRRLLVAVPMLLGAMSIVFFAMRVLPGDPCVAMMGEHRPARTVIAVSELPKPAFLLTMNLTAVASHS